MSGTDPPVSDATITELAQMARVLFTTPHEEQRRQARAALAGFSIAPQNVMPFLYVMTKTQDPYALQFVLQSLRRIVARHWKQLDSSTLPHICSVSIDFLASYAPQLPRYLVSSASQLIARTLKAAWIPVPAVREFAAARLSTLLPRSPQHCLVVLTLWGEIIAEFSPRRRADAASKLADVSFGDSRRATVAFGASALLAILTPTLDVLSRVVAGSLTFEPSTTAAPGAGVALAAVPGAALSLLQACLRYDFHGLNPDEWDETELLMLPNSPAWRAVVESPALLSAVIGLLPGAPGPAGPDASAGETGARALDVITTILTVRPSSWSSSRAHMRIVRHCLLGVLPLFAILASPDPDTNGAPLLADEEELLAAAGRLLMRLSAISWAEVTEALAPGTGGGPLRLVALSSRGPGGSLEGLRASPAPGAQFGAGETVGARAVTAEYAVIDTTPPNGVMEPDTTTVDNIRGIRAMARGAPEPGDVAAADAARTWINVMRSFTQAVIAAAVADASAPAALLSSTMGYVLAYWAKAAESCSAGVFSPSLHAAVLDASLAAVAGLVDARLGFVDATCSRPGVTIAAASTRLSDLVQEPGFSEQLLPLAMICRHHPAGAAHSLVAALDAAAGTYRELLSQADVVAAAAAGRGSGMQPGEYALRLLAAETRLSFLVALSAAVLAPNRLGGPRPSAMNTSSSLVFGAAASDFAGVATLRALFGIDLPSPPRPPPTIAPTSAPGTGAGLTGTALFAALGHKSGKSSEREYTILTTRTELQNTLDVAETVLTVTVWSLLPLLPVRLGVLTAGDFSAQSSAAARGIEALRSASMEGGSPATVAAASAGAGATARVLSLLGAEPVPVDPATGAPRQAPGWGSGDGVFYGVPLDGLPPPVDLAAERAAAGFGSGSSDPAAGAGAPPLGAGSITAVPVVNTALPPRSASLDRALLAFVRAFVQRYCAISQLRMSGTSNASPVFTTIGEAMSWIRPLPAPGSASSQNIEADGVTFFGEGGDWSIPHVFAALFPPPGAGSGQSPLVQHVTFNARDAVDVVISLLTGAIYYWSHPAHRDEAALGAALELFHDITSMYSISSNLLALPATAALVNAHTASPLGRDASLAPYRRLFYECVARIMTHTRPSVPRLRLLLITFDAAFGALSAELQSPAPAAHAPALALGLCTALHGIFEACDSNVTYSAVFSWAFPDYVSLLTRAVEAWWGDGAVLEALLDLFVEMSENRYSRIFFPPASPDAALFYKACALVIETYCSRAVRVKAPEAPGSRKTGGLGITESGAVAGDDDDDDDDDTLSGSAATSSGGAAPVQEQRRYATKLQAVQSCLELAYRALSGFCPLGAFVAFGDRAVDGVTAAVLGVVASLDRGDVLGRPELALSLFRLLEVTFDVIPTAVLRVPQNVFVAVIRILADAVSLYSGLPQGSSLSHVHTLAVEALAHLFRFTRTITLSTEGTIRDEAFARGGSRVGSSLARRTESMSTVQLLQRQVASAQSVLTELLAHVLTQFVFETGEVQGSLTRVVMPFIYTCSEAWENYLRLLASTAPSAAAADVAAGVANPMDPAIRVQTLLRDARALADAAKRVFEDPDDSGTHVEPPPPAGGNSVDELEGVPMAASEAAVKVLMDFRETAVKLFRRPDGF